MTDSGGGVTRSTYNSQGELVTRSLTEPGQGTIGVAFVYDPAGQVTTIIRTADGQTTGSTAYTYNAYGEVTDITDRDASGRLIDGFQYTYDAAGRVASETENGAAPLPSTPVDPTRTSSAAATAPTATRTDDPLASSPAPTDGAASGPGDAIAYTYDPSGQLLKANSDVYHYDANGNRTSPGYLLGPDNQVLSDGTWDYAYDADGNRISQTDIATGATWKFAYDDANRLTSATEYDARGQEVTRVSYAYDVFGNLIERTVATPGTSTPAVERFAYDGTQAWAELNGQDQVTTSYLSGDEPNQVLARESPSGSVGWYLTDRLGSVRDIVANDGTVLDKLTYDAYGNITSETDPSAGDQYAYAGMWRDGTTGLYFDHARWYDSGTGTWTSVDPRGLDAGDANLDRYVGNNPISTTDPTGELWGWVFAGVGAGVGASVYAVSTLATGGTITKGGLVGAAVGGAVAGLGVGAVTGDVSAAGAIAIGAVSGASGAYLGSVVRQGVDKGIDGISNKEALVEGAAGAAGGAVGMGVLGKPAAAGVGRVLASGALGGGTGGAVQGGGQAAINGGSAGDIAREASVGFARGAITGTAAAGVAYGTAKVIQQVTPKTIATEVEPEIDRTPLPEAGDVAPSRTAVEALADSYRGQIKAGGPKTVAVLETPNGVFNGRSAYSGGLHPVVQELVDANPGLYQGACAECDAINQALRAAEARTGQPITTVEQARQALSGSFVQTARVRGPNSVAHGTPLPPCVTCQPLLDALGIPYR